MPPPSPGCTECEGTGWIWDPCPKRGHQDFCPGDKCRNECPCGNCAKGEAIMTAQEGER